MELLHALYIHDMSDEWGMGINGDQLLPKMFDFWIILMKFTHYMSEHCKKL